MPYDGDRDRSSDGPELGDRRIDAAGTQPIGRDEAPELAGGDQEHLVGDLSHLGNDCPEADAWEYEDVVCLPDHPSAGGCRQRRGSDCQRQRARVHLSTP